MATKHYKHRDSPFQYIYISDRRAVDSELQAQAVQIKNIELQNIDRYLQAVGTQAALIAGFSITTICCDSLIEKTNEDYHWTLQCIYYLTAVGSLCFEFYCVTSSTLVSVLGPTYALNGPKGSMHTAVRAMKEERIQILYAFGAGLVCFGLTMILVFWILMKPPAAGLCTILVTCFFLLIGQSAKRIGIKFKYAAEMQNMNEKLSNVDAHSFLRGQDHQETSRRIDGENKIKSNYTVN